MQKAIELSLLSELSPSPPDVEALRVYVVLPWCHAFSSPAENYKELHVPFANILLSLTINPSKVLGWRFSLISPAT